MVCLGSGGVGQVAVQLLRILPTARLVVVEPNPARAATARRLGARIVGYDGGVRIAPGVRPGARPGRVRPYRESRIRRRAHPPWVDPGITTRG